MMLEILAAAIHHTIEYGDFDIYVVKGGDDKEHIVLIRGVVNDCEHVLCRISSECLPGTALFSAECDCKQQIQFALRSIAENGQGIFIYLRQEGRGHGLTTKIRALANKNKGLDTFAAVECMGLSADIREYSIVRDILELFNVRSIKIMCNNPDKTQALMDEGVVISDVLSIPIVPNIYSIPHLRAKQEHGHDIELKENIK